VADPRIERYATLLLDTCLRVEAGWQVVVWGYPNARPLLEAVTREIGRRGAYPLLRLTFGGGLVYHRDWVRHAPLELLGRPAPIDVHTLDNCDALLAIAVAWGFGMGSVALGNTWWETTLQRLIPEHVYSRVRSYDILVSFVFMPIGMIAFGPLTNWLGLEHTLLAAALIAAITNLAVAFTPAVRAVTGASETSAATLAA